MKKSKLALFALTVVLLALSTALAAPPKDTVIIAQGVDPSTLDPANHQETPAFNICLNIFDTLLVRDDQLKMQPLLATSYRLINENTWEFKLRQGVTFHNGEKFNAESVKYTLERMADPKNKLRQSFFQGVIERVEVPDEYTARVITRKPYPYLDAQLSHIGHMLPPKYSQEKGPAHFAANPIGTGPYKFVRWVKDDQLLLEANDQYWQGVPKIKKVIFRPIPEATTRVAGLQTRELDLIVNIPPHLSKLMDWKGRSYVSKVPSSRAIFLAFDNTKGGPVADKRVRLAIAHAVNLENIIKKVLDGNGINLGTPLTPYHFGYDPSFKPHVYNPERAKKLLADAGYPNGFDLTLNSPNGRYLNDKEVSEAVVGDLRKAGINAQVRIHEWGTYINMLYAHNGHPSYLLGWGGATFDADGTFFPLLRTKQVLSHFTHPPLDGLIDEARSIMDKKKRLDLYKQANKIFQEEVPWAFAYQQLDIYGVSDRLNWKSRGDEKIFVYNMSFKK
jgi:peptide/nickel transport system substrate-binding protein